MTSKTTLYGLAFLLVCAGCSSSEPSNPPSPGGTGGDPPDASDALCGERPGGDIRATHVLRFETRDGRAVIQIKRTWESPGVGESSVYRLDGFSVLLDGTATCVTESSRLEYENTHHNWADVARADAGTMRFEVTSTNLALDTFSAFAADGSALFDAVPVISTGSPPFCWECPAVMGVWISEVMLNNTTTLADEAGEYEPWIELFNPSAGDVDLTGWTLSDDFGDRRKWALPAITLPRHETLVLFADGDTDQGELHTSFALDPSGGELILTRSDGTTDGGLVLGPQAPSESLAFQWTVGNYVLGRPTPGEKPPEP